MFHRPLLILVSLLCLPLFVQNRARADKIDDYVEAEMSRQHLPGLSLAVVKGGKPVKVRAYGFANVELNVRATPETVFQIQSITKQFTATAIMMLVEEGKIGLDEKLGTYLDGTPETWKDVTIRHLLTNTSGIKDFINEPTANLRLEVTEQQVFNATVPRPLNFPVGDRYAYSNTGYHLLAMVIRKVTGKFYGDFLRERIFDPLRMKNTRIIRWDEIIPNRAAGYLWENGRRRNGEFIAGSVLGYGGGGIRSTVLDMALWDAALYTERLLKKSSLEQMWTPAKFNNGKPSTYGFGWGIEEIQGHKNINHSGSHATGFQTEISRFVNDKLTVIILVNSRPSDPHRMARRIAGFYIPDLAPPPIHPMKLSSSLLSSYVGRYEVARNPMFTIFTAHGRMWARHDTRGVEEIVPVATNKFRYATTGGELTFLTNDRGETTNVVDRFEPVERRATRIGALFKDLRAMPDADPALTVKIESMLEKLATRGAGVGDWAEAIMTSGARAQFAQPQPELSDIQSIRFVSSDDVSKISVTRHGGKVARINYFKMATKTGSKLLLVHLTTDSLVTDWDLVEE